MFSLALCVTLVSFIWSGYAAAGNISCDYEQSIVTHPIPPGSKSLESFTVKVRSSVHVGTTQKVSPFLVEVAEANTTNGASMIHNTSVAYFDFCDPVEVAVTYNHGPIRSAVVRPYSYNITPRIYGDTISFSLLTPKNVVVQVNNEIWDVLHLFTNNIEADAPAPTDQNVIYFGPGINNNSAISNLTNGELLIPSEKWVYVSSGATVTVPLVFDGVSNAGIRGRGLLRNSSVEVRRSSNAVVEDLVLVNSNIGIYESSEVVVQGIRSFSAVAWGDGIDSYCSHNVLIDSVFMRNSDDNIALYQHRDTWYGNSSNLTIQNASLWADYAHPINIGTHGNTADPEMMDGVTIRNIDVLDHREPQMWYQGCLAINVGDSNLIRNVLVDGMRVENFREGQLINLRVMNGSKYNTSPGRGIHNVYIKDLSYHGTHANPSWVLGYDSQRVISNVTFDNLVVNGKRIYDAMEKPTWYFTADFVPMFANEHVHNLSFVLSL